jgi:hypothetical protein
MITRGLTRRHRVNAILRRDRNEGCGAAC